MLAREDRPPLLASRVSRQTIRRSKWRQDLVGHPGHDVLSRHRDGRNTTLSYLLKPTIKASGDHK